MKIVIAPDSFKESLGAPQVAEAIAAGFGEIFPEAECLQLPVADGGEGTVETLVAATGGRFITVTVHDALGRKIEARYGCDACERTAFIEMAAASGLELLKPSERNPLVTGTFGTGELLLDALNRGFTDIILGIGGSATNDGGAGMLQALGIQLLNGSGRELPPGGGTLVELAQIDASGLAPQLASCRLQVACDVDNPLLGKRGASAVFGPQKGADAAMVARLDASLGHYADLVEKTCGREIRTVPGAGAAGGMGAALLAFCGAELRPGVEIVLQAVGLQKALAGADLVITGEGRMDGQSVAGKTPIGVARCAQKQGVPVIALAGSLGEGAEKVLECGIDALFPVLDSVCTLPQALACGAENLRRTAQNVAAVWRLGGR